MSKRYDYIPSMDFDNIRHDISNSNQYSRESQYPLANHLFYEEQNRSKKVLTTFNTTRGKCNNVNTNRLQYKGSI